LTKNEVLQLYKDGRRLFTSYHDEAARVPLNRILESNAAEEVKNKARTLLSFMEVPGFDTLKDSFSYSEVAAEPLLYRDCYVSWKGMAANVTREEHTSSFDLLVGYDTRRVMEGAVNVVLDFPAEINPSVPLEVLGRIVILPGGRFMLEAEGIHQLGR
jgi:hypothetical protein